MVVPQTLCQFAYDCFKLHLRSTCLSINRIQLIIDSDLAAASSDHFVARRVKNVLPTIHSVQWSRGQRLVTQLTLQAYNPRCYGGRCFLNLSVCSDSQPGGRPRDFPDKIIYSIKV